MSVVASAVLFGLLVVAAIHTRWVRASGAVVCVVFGFLLASTPAGPSVSAALGGVGHWAYAELRAL